MKKIISPITEKPKNWDIYRDGECVRKYIKEYNCLPYKIKTMVDTFIHIQTGDKMFVPEFPGYECLANYHPRGWDKDDTWWDVPGCYGVHGIVLGDDDAHGSLSMTLHEVGHAVDVLKERPSNKESFLIAYALDYDSLDSYEQQPGVGGPSETFADVFSWLFYSNKSKNQLQLTKPYLYTWFMEWIS